jgi:hypothetical protein
LAIDAATGEYGFDIWLGLCLAALFAAVPYDV